MHHRDTLHCQCTALCLPLSACLSLSSHVLNTVLTGRAGAAEHTVQCLTHWQRQWSLRKWSGARCLFALKTQLWSSPTNNRAIFEQLTIFSASVLSTVYIAIIHRRWCGFVDVLPYGWLAVCTVLKQLVNSRITIWDSMIHSSSDVISLVWGKLIHKVNLLLIESILFFSLAV